MRGSVSMPGGWGNTRATADVRDALSHIRILTLPAWRWLARHGDQLSPLPVVLLTAVLHAVNLFGFPYHHTDEGTYVAQAWAILRRGDLSHYTYWYDHAPLGWIQIAAWTVLSQGFYTFGTPIDGGRVLMLVLHCWSTYLVFQIARTVSRSVLTATLAGLLFCVSAYGIYYHRRVLLDNVTTPWMLLSILMILRTPLALSRVWVSAVALGVSILSKELTVFLVPVLGALVCMRATRSQRLFATLTWLFIVLALVSTYPLMALLKNEMFQAGTLLGGQQEHVSLIESLRYQAARGRDAGLLSLTSSFWRETASWAAVEPLLAVGGSLGAVAGALLVRRFPLYGAVSLSTLALYAFLARGGIILGFYYLPLLPLLALNVALPLGWAIQWVPSTMTRYWRSCRWPRLAQRSTQAVSWVRTLLCVTPMALGYQSGAIGLERDSLGLWTIPQTAGQHQAVDWIRRYLHPESAILVDDEYWVALREPPRGQPAFRNAHWYIKIDGDPEIRSGVFKDDPRNVEFILNTQDVYDRTREPDVPLAQAAIDASTPIAAFDSGRYPVEIRRVHRLNRWRASQDPMLVRSWTDFKAGFVRRGRVVDSAAGATTSQAQALAMLRSVYMDDRATFEELWAWTRARLQVRGDGLLVRRYGTDPSGSDAALDRATASIADQDAALALLFASKLWRQSVYHQHALQILDSIWRHETAAVTGKRIVVAGDWARGSSGEAIVSPAALQPHAYRIFAAADSPHPWRDLVDSSYQLMARIQTNPEFGSNAGVVPNLIAVDVKNGSLKSATRVGSHADEFSGDSGSVSVRFALDLVWSGEHRARQVLDRLSLPRREIATHGWLADSYDLAGRATVERESTAMYAGILPSLLFRGSDDLAHLIFADRILRPAYDPGSRPFAGGSSVDDLTWAWFATAFMHGGLANLWQGEATVNWPNVLSQIAATPTTQQPGLKPEVMDAILAAGSARSAIVSPAELRHRGSSESAHRSTAAAISRPEALSQGTTRRPRPAPSGTATDSAGASSPPVAASTARPVSSQEARSQKDDVAPVDRAPDPPVDASSLVSTAAVRAPVQAPPDMLKPSAASGPSFSATPRPLVVPIFRPTPAQATFATYVVQPGDRLLDIAERLGTDVDALVVSNAIDDPDLITVGTSLRVPTISASHTPEDQP